MSRTRVAVGAAVLGAALATAAVAVGVGTASAAGGSGEEAETPITGAALERASQAALAETGGGSVTDTEVGDEESLYEVEVTLADGSEVDVQLDETFAVVATEAEGSDG